MKARPIRILIPGEPRGIPLDDDFVLIEAVTPPWLVGQLLGDTNLRRDYKVTVVCIKPDDGAFTYAESSTVLGANDLIVVAGHRADITRFAETAV